MLEEEAGPSLPSIPTVLYTALGATAVYGLSEKVPRLLSDGPSEALAPLALDVFFFGFACVSLAKGMGLIGKIDYAALDGRDVGSLAKEAGAWAAAGEVPTQSPDGFEVATFAGGCFWGTELHFQRIPGVVATCVGYTQGGVPAPTYEQVCSGTTGHTEALQLLFDPSECSYESLCAKLLSTVDPTARNRVGNDRGTQYRHGIYSHTPEQAEAARRALELEQAKQSAPVVTEMLPARVFYPAENYHQRYLQKGGQNAAKNAPEKVRCYG